MKTPALRLLARQLVDRRRYTRRPDRYWDARHDRYGAGLEGVGCICLGEEENRSDYEAKWERIRPLVEGLPPGSHVLDAGCGNGFLTARMQALGLLVEGVDFSAAAIAAARTRLGAGPALHVSPLDRFDAGRRYDAVVCIDVLFHVVDDDRWRRTVQNLASLAGRELLIQDHLVPVAGPQGADGGAVHCRWRTLEMYRQALGGWELASHDVYHLPFERVSKDLLRFVAR